MPVDGSSSSRSLGGGLAKVNSNLVFKFCLWGWYTTLVCWKIENENKCSKN
ncbi:MAG: hypothetical protein ACI8YQ_003352 [Polaribacter sp.]|jgi:hypothetical protein